MTGDVPSTVPVDPDRPGGPPPRLALYRRYRPATFAEVKGQDHVTEPLRQALRTGRVNHAYLFSGPRGCGKTTSARILARSLNCAEGPTPDPCGKCESCVALAPDGPGSLDVIEIDAASHGGVDDARDLRERAFYAPVSGRFKIYIIDEAHMVTREGFNALLKLVEEPPPHLKFVFATTEPEKVIATIRSRTHHYPFRLVPPAILRELLEEILGAEQIAYEPAVLPLVVRAGAGSARDSLSVLDQLLAGAGEEGLRYDRTVALLGYTDENLLDEVAEAFANEDGAAVFRAVNRVMEGGHDPRRFATDLLDRFRDLIVLAAVPGRGPDRAARHARGPARPDDRAGRPVRPGRADPGGGDRQRGADPDARGDVAPAAPGAHVRADPAACRVFGRQGPAGAAGTAGTKARGRGCPVVRPGRLVQPRPPPQPRQPQPPRPRRPLHLRRPRPRQPLHPRQPPADPVPASAPPAPPAAAAASAGRPAQGTPQSSPRDDAPDAPRSGPAAPSRNGQADPSPASAAPAPPPAASAAAAAPAGASPAPRPPRYRPARQRVRPPTSTWSGSAGRRSSKRSRASAGWPGCCSATPPCTRSRVAC